MVKTDYERSGSKLAANDEEQGPRPPAPDSRRVEGLASDFTTLEIKGLKCGCGDTSYEVVGQRCNCRTCPVCGKRIGSITRQVLLRSDILAMFPRPALFTLTIDRSCFKSPQEAWEAVRSNLRELMYRLGVKVYVWVLEFQWKTGDGWPHWHFLINLPSGGRIDYKLAWHLWRHVWNLGRLKVSRHENQNLTAAHAVNYITKYMLKPAAAYPRWWVEGKRRRMVGGSQCLGSLTGQESRIYNPPVSPVKLRPAKPLYQRMALCHQTFVLLEVTVNPETGEVRHRHVGTVEASINSVLAISVGASLWVTRELVTVPVETWAYANGEVSYYRKRIVLEPGLTAAEALRAFTWAIREEGVDLARIEAIEAREVLLLDAWRVLHAA